MTYESGTLEPDSVRGMFDRIAPDASVPTVDIEQGETTYASTFAEPLA